MKKIIISAILISQILIAVPSQAADVEELKVIENLAEKYKKEKKLPEAVKEYEKLISLLPNNIGYYQELGDLYLFGLKDNNMAISIYTEGVQHVNPKMSYSVMISHDFLDGLNRELNNDSKKVDEAVEFFTYQLKSTTNLYFSMAYYYSQIDNDKEQEKYLLKGIEINPLDWRFYVNLGSFYKNKNQHDKAVDILTKGLKNIKNNSYLLNLNLALVYQDMGLLDKAVDSYKETIKAEPKFAGAYYNLASINLNKSDDKEAINLLKELLKQNPDEISASEMITNTYLKNQEYDNAISFINTSIDKKNSVLYHRLLGIVYKSKGEVNKAKENLSFSCQNGEQKSCDLLKTLDLNKN